MPRPKTRPPAGERVKTTVEFDLDTYNHLQTYCALHGLVRNTFVRDAITAQLSILEAKKPRGVRK